MDLSFYSRWDNPAAAGLKKAKKLPGTSHPNQVQIYEGLDPFKNALACQGQMTSARAAKQKPIRPKA
jgi:hypothetical protein